MKKLLTCIISTLFFLNAATAQVKMDTVGKKPIDLVSFQAIQYGDSVILQWTTSVELNNDYFTIERWGGPDTNFISTGTVQGAGSSVTLKNYNFIDLGPFEVSGSYLYILIQTDFDGSFTYASDTISVYFVLSSVSELLTGENTFTVYPNPSTGLITLRDLPEEPERITIYNVLGAIVYDQWPNVSGEPEIDLSAFPDGLYLIELESGQMTLRRKVIKQ